MSRQMQELRTVRWPLLNPDTGLLYCDRVCWADLEPEPGRYDFAAVREAVERAARIKRCVLLRIGLPTPAGKPAAAGDFLRLLEAAGREFGDERAIWGVDVTCPAGEGSCSAQDVAALAQGFALAFPHAFLFVQAGSAFEQQLRGSGRIGVIVERDTLAQYAGSWQHMPLRMRVDSTKPAAVQAAIDGHVSVLEAAERDGANTATHAGYRFEVRTVCMEQDASGVKVTAVIANTGALPCYTDAAFQLRLCGSDVPDVREYPLGMRAADVHPGEAVTAACTLDVTGLVHGEYDLHIGLFCAGTGYPVSFGIEGRISDGYYESRLILRL